MKIRFERPSGTAEQSRGLRVDYSAAKRNIPAWRWNLIVLLLLSPVLYFVGRAVLDQVWVSAPGVVELKRATLHAGLDGRIEFIATAGQRVAAGATLATILPALPLPVPESPAPVLPARDRRKELSGAAQLLDYRRERLASYRQLVRQGAATQAELANALSQFREAESAYRRLGAEMAMEGTLEAHRRMQTAAQIRPAERLAAPFPGVVSQAQGTAGDWTTAGSPLVTLVDDRSVLIKAYLDPRHSRYAEPGRRVNLDFGDGTSLRARVAGVQPETAPASAEPAGPMEARMDALQVVLEPDAPVPERYRKHKLPLSVRFDFVWK